MPCYYPVGTYYQNGEPVYRPCGRCIGCRLEYARQWAIRCVHEASLNNQNAFITLTYNDKNLPEDRSVSKEELQKFVKRLRKKIEPKKIRYFGCGEYGKRFHRPHYHICIFGHMFEDIELVRSEKKSQFRNRFKTTNPNNLYSSKILEKIWKKGFTSIGELTFESAGYTARYITKKITGDKSLDHYKGKEPEFALMSRRPGIGTKWIDSFMYDVYPKDFHTLRGIKMRPNRFYDEKYKKSNPEGYKEIKKKRKKFNDKHAENPAGKLVGYRKEKYRKNVTKSLERKLENG